MTHTRQFVTNVPTCQHCGYEDCDCQELVENELEVMDIEGERERHELAVNREKNMTDEERLEREIAERWEGIEDDE